MNKITSPYKILALILATVFLFIGYTSGISHNPPGFYVDESGFAFNAYLIGRTGVSEFGVSWPLFFQFYTPPFVQLGNPTQIYLLALVFAVLSPSILLARLYSAAWVFVASLLLGYLAVRISRRYLVGVIVALNAVLTPWLFELSRLVLDLFFYPFALVLFLSILYRTHTRRVWTLLDGALIAISLAFLTYSYSIGRLLAPLLAVGLLIFVTNRQRLRGVLATWFFYALTLIPLFLYNLKNPGVLGARFQSQTYLTRETTWASAVFQFLTRYLEDASIVRLLVTGDVNPRHHVPRSLGSFLAGTFILSLIGIVVIFARYRKDAWWRYILFGLAVSLIPGALTFHRFHTLRLIAYPVFLLVVTIPALVWLLNGNKPETESPQERQLEKQNEQHTFLRIYFNRRAHRAILVGLLLATVLQVAYFQIRYRRDGPKRANVFDAAYKDVYDATMLQPNRPIYLVDGSGGPAYIHAYWYAALEGRNRSEFVHVEAGRRPPSGALVISSQDKCSDCEIVLRRGIYMVYRAL